ncbi:MAG: 50S ribosomal protein L15 [Clostridia bacterium]|nr:50S ribosomal protein L15 [Clostridia bacterium]MBR6558022.1 50S ribosomal protein L15 [Clostridia bacterium]
MKLHELSPAEGSSTKAWRKGRGPGSGNGKTGGRGHKGQNARSGGGVRPGFEGGQLPLYRKLPKRGFNNKFGKEFAIINIDRLDAAFDNGAVIDIAALKEKGIIKVEKDGLKVLGNGAITKQFTVRASVFSASAKEKIEAAGGKTEVV